MLLTGKGEHASSSVFLSAGNPLPRACCLAGNLLFVLAFQWRSLAALLLARLLNGLGSARTANRRYTAGGCALGAPWEWTGSWSTAPS